MVFNLFRDTKENIQPELANLGAKTDSYLSKSAERYNLLDRVRKIEGWMNKREPDIKNMLTNIQIQQKNLQTQQNNLQNTIENLKSTQSSLNSAVKNISVNQENIQISLNNAQLAFDKSKESWESAYQAALDATQALDAAKIVSNLATDAKNKAIEASNSAAAAYKNATNAVNQATSAWDAAKKTWDTSMSFFERSFKDLRDKSVKLANSFSGFGNIFINEANAAYAKSRDVINAGALKEWQIIGDLKITVMKTPLEFVRKLVASIVQNYNSFSNLKDGAGVIQGDSYALYQSFELLYKEITEIMNTTYKSAIAYTSGTTPLTQEEVYQIEQEILIAEQQAYADETEEVYASSEEGLLPKAPYPTTEPTVVPPPETTYVPPPPSSSRLREY